MKQINIFMEIVVCMAADCKSDSKCPRDESLKQQWLTKIKRRNIQST